MSIYDNKTKIYPDLNPTAPQEQQTYRLIKLTEIEAYLLNEIEVRERTAKNMKRFNKITGIVETGLITSTVIFGRISIAVFASGVGLPVGIVLSVTSLLLSLATVVTRKFFKIFIVKQEKHDSIRLLAQSKLDSIADIISQAVRDGDISSIEFHKILQEVEKYRKLKADIRNLAKAKIKQIKKEQREELLEQGRKEGKADFLRKIANTSGTQGVSAILFLFSCSVDGVYSTFLQVLTATSCSFIIGFVTPGRLQKSFYTSKNLSSLSSLKMLHFRFSASVHLHSSTYT